MATKSAFLRYGETYDMSSKMEILEDIRNLLYALAGKEYMADRVSEHTGLSGQDLKTASEQAAAYVRVALEFLDQARNGPRRIAALPLYYVVHNLAKVYITLGRCRSELPNNRHHGVSYDPSKENPGDLLTEELAVKPKGVLPLLYKTLTGQDIKPFNAQLKDIYCYIREVSAEYEIVSNQKSKLLYCEGLLRLEGEHHYPLVLAEQDEAKKVSRVEELKTLMDFTSSDNARTCRGKNFLKTVSDVDQEGRKQLRTFLLYLEDPVSGQDGTMCCIPISDRDNYLPEELPIFLAVYHLSSAARYKPILLDELLSSRHAPLILGLQSHAVMKFLLLTWSFVHSKNLVIRNA